MKTLVFLSDLSFLFLLISLTTACDDATFYTGPRAEIANINGSLIINSRGEIILDTSYDVISLGINNLGKIGWTVGFEKVLNQSKNAQNYLYLIWQNQNGEMMQTSYDIGKPFDINFSTDQWVREIKHTKEGNIIVTIEIKDREVLIPDLPQSPPIEPQTKISSSDPTKPPSKKCPGAPKKRVSVGDDITICTKKETVFLRTEPRASASYTHRLIPGAELKVVGGPVCDTTKSWWYWNVRTESGYKGWVAEGGDAKDPYFICP